MKINSQSGFRKNNNNSASHDQHKTIYDTWNEFVKLWKNGQDAVFNANCKNGRAWLNLSTYLGYNENQNSNENAMEDETFITEVTPNPKRSRSSPSKLRRNKERAAAYREKKRQKSSEKASSGSHFENTDLLTETLNTNSSHLEAVDSSADFQTTKENVNHHDRANETISDFHNGVFSSTMKNGNDESRGKDLEVQIVQQNSSTP